MHSPLTTTPGTPRAATTPRLVHLVAATVAALLALTLLAGPAGAAVPTFGKAIEPYARYAGQSTCDPTAKAGTKKLAAWLQATYRGTGSSGITRACSVGGRSEHKEGRAFDWKVDVRVPAQARAATAFAKLAFATDAHGNKHAIARRMGIMYIVWNKRIWYATDPTRWHPYTGANPHTDHMHISLSWSGAKGLTSFWSGGKVATGG